MGGGGWEVPSPVVPARSLNRPDWRPCSILAGDDGHAVILQFSTRSASGKKEVGSDLGQARRSVRLDHGSGKIHTDYPIAVEVLVESVFQRLQCRAASRHGGDEIRLVVAVAVGAPYGIKTGTGVFPSHVVAAGRLHRADRSHGAKLARYNVPTGVFQRRI